MPIISINGGLGNQLFQYAFSKHIEKKYNVIFKYDLSDFVYKKIHDGFILDKLIEDDFTIAGEKDLSEVTALLRCKYGRAILRRLCIFNDVINYENCSNPEARLYSYYMGNWQNLKIDYISCIEDKLLDLTPNFPPSLNSVFVHVRRGDYLKNTLYAICDMAYYEKAIRHTNNAIRDCKFYVLSDDIAWCEDNFAMLKSEFNINFVNNNASLDDFNFMRSCNHAIISNSTFSWWAAQLIKNQDKLIINPKIWFTNQDHEIMRPNSWLTF